MRITEPVAFSYGVDGPRFKKVTVYLRNWRLCRFPRLDRLYSCLVYGSPCRFLCLCIMLFSISLTSGCATTATHYENQVNPSRTGNPGRALAAIARGLLGVPYRWGGNSPNGLDCSGLVQYAHFKAGIRVPRNSEDQLIQASPVHPAHLHPGDLVFFKMSWRNKPSHVGIYAGNGRFIHAPSSGKSVSYASLQNPYWKERLVAAGRFY